MPVPTSISELSTTPGSNSPSGSDSPSVLDDHQRTAYAFIRTLSDTKAASADAVLLTGAQTVAGVKTFSSTIVGSVNGNAGTATTAAGLSATLAIASGGTGQTTAALAFGALKQAATTSVSGVSPLATSAVAITGTSTTDVITPSTMKAAQIVLGTAVTASGTAIDITGIPSYANRVTVMLDRISTNGGSPPLLQLGDSGGIENSAYQGTSVRFQNAAAVDLTSHGTGFVINGNAAANTLHGTLTLQRMTGTTWSCTGVLGCTGNAFQFTLGGQKALSGVLDRIRLTTVGGTETFDDGTLNISWE